MAEKSELQYRDPRAMVRRLRDNLSRELAGLSEDNAVRALIYAEERLADEIQAIRLVLNVVEVDDGDDAGDV